MPLTAMSPSPTHMCLASGAARLADTQRRIGIAPEWRWCTQRFAHAIGGCARPALNDCGGRWIAFQSHQVRVSGGTGRVQRVSGVAGVRRVRPGAVRPVRGRVRRRGELAGG